MDRNSQYLSTHPKENLGQNLLMKKSTSDNYIKYKIMKTTQNPMSMANFTQVIKIQQDTTQTQNYMIGKSKTTRCKKEVARPFKQCRRNQSNNVSQFPSSQKYSEKKQGIPYLKTNKCKHQTNPKIQRKRITSYAYRTSIQKHW